MIFKQKVFSSIKLLISILEPSSDDGTKTHVTSVVQMLCSTNLDIITLYRVFAAPFFKPEYEKSLVPLFATPFQTNCCSTRGRGRGIYHKADEDEEGPSQIQMPDPLFQLWCFL